MTAASLPLPLPPHVQTGKTSATAQGSRVSTKANPPPLTSRSSNQSRSSRSTKSNANADFASKKATIALIRRWLCASASHGDSTATAQKPIEALLPPLTSSNEVDLHLYAIIAIIIKDFVYAWYTKITPDHVFVDEVVQIIAHCTRALEQRLRRVDIAQLVLDEIPALVDAHVQASRIAIASSASSPYDVPSRVIYHSLNTHPAMGPVPGSDPESATRQAENERMYRQLLIQGALAVLLPTEDLENICLRTLVTDVLADLILGQGVGGKVCEPWFLWETITKLVEAVKAHIEPKATGKEIEVDTKHRLEKFGLLSSKDEALKSNSPRRRQSRFADLFWRILQYCYLSYVFLRFVIVGLYQARAARPRPHATVSPRSNPTSPVQSAVMGISTPSSPWLPDAPTLRRPVVEFRLFTMMAGLLDLSTRMPWLFGLLSWLQHTIVSGAGRVGDIDGLLDRFLHKQILTYVLPPSLIPPVLHQARINIFPNNSLGPPAPPPPSPEKQRRIRRKAAKSILSLIPNPVAKVYFAVNERQSPPGTPDEKQNGTSYDGHEVDSAREDMIHQIEEILDIALGDAYRNKHLIYGILETIILRLVPELADSTPTGLLKDRGLGEEGL